MIAFVAVFLTSFLTALLLTPRIINFAKSIGALDYPAKRTVHKLVTPRLGGLAIIVTFTVNIAAFLLYKILTQRVEIVSYLKANQALVGIFIGAFFIMFIGVVDDIYDISPLFKFIAQTVAALIAVFFGVSVEFIGSPGGGIISIPFWLGAFLSVFWIVTLTNTINFIDGLDGLASGIVALNGAALFVIAYQTGRMDIAVSLVVLVGSLLGFLRYNFHPAKIFMGDSGSMFLGYFIGAITIQSAAKSAAMISLLVPLIIMGIPVFDGAYAVFRRFVNRRPLTRADREHIHHVLLYKGLSHKGTVLLMYGWTLVLSIIGLALSLRIDIFWHYRVIILVLLLPVSFFLAYYSGLFDWLVKSKDKKTDSG